MQLEQHSETLVVLVALVVVALVVAMGTRLLLG
jgi:hypothetical protein